MLRQVQFASIALVCGCSPAPAPPDTSDAATDAAAVDMPSPALMDHAAWVAVDPNDDPFDDRPAVVECEKGIGWDAEPLDVTETIGIDTVDCNYLGVVQPIGRPLRAGEPLALQLWHFQLEGDGPAHVGIAVNGEVLFETTVEIPSASGLIVEEFTADEAPAGAPLVFHLHNHGLNSWNLVTIASPDDLE